MLKKIVLAAVLFAVLAAGARADVSYAPFALNCLDDQGNPIFNGTAVIVLDLDGDGWNGHSYISQAPQGTNNAASWLWDNDDMLMARVQVNDGLATPSATIATANIPATYSAGVDHYYLLWFNVQYDVADPGPGAGVRYGAEDLGTVGADPGSYPSFPGGGQTTLSTLGAAVSWHNSSKPADVNGDGLVSLSDAGLVISRLNVAGPKLLTNDPLPGAGGWYWDVSNDGFLSPLDALRVYTTYGQEHSGASAPEPATLCLLLGGSIMMFRRRKGI